MMDRVRIVLLLTAALVWQSASAADRVDVAPGVSLERKTFPAPVNEAPFFNFAEPTAEHRAANELLLRNVATVEPDRSKAAAHAILSGWKALLKDRDPATAAKRFNQAWLLAPEQSGIYHGLAAVVQTRFGDMGYADQLMTIAARMKAVAPALPADHARILLMANRPADAVPLLQRAIENDPDWAVPRSNLALATLQLGRPAEACELARAVRGRDLEAVARDLAYLRGKAGC